MEKILFTLGDAYPVINLTLRDRNTGDPTDPESWDPIRLNDPTTSVSIEFTKRGQDGVVGTAQCTKVSGGADGKVVFSVPVEVSSAVGTYEGAIIINRNGLLETLKEKLKIKVRS